MKLTSELQQLVNAIHVDLHVPVKIDRMRAFLRLNTPLGQQLLQMHPRFSAQCREKLSELYMYTKCLEARTLHKTLFGMDFQVVDIVNMKPINDVHSTIRPSSIAVCALFQDGLKSGPLCT